MAYTHVGTKYIKRQQDFEYFLKFRHTLVQAPLQLRWGALWGEDPCNEWGNTRGGQMGCKGPMMW